MVDFSEEGLDQYLISRDLESVDGVWIAFPNDRQLRVLRAGGSNKAFLRVFQALSKPYKRQLEKGTLDPDESDRVMREVYARTVIMDWRGILDTKGKPVPFNHENCIAFLEKFPEIFNDIVAIASDMATFAERRLEQAKQDLGNS